MTKNAELKLFSTVSPEQLKIKLLEIGVKEKFITNHFEKYFYIIHKIYINDVINKNEDVCRLSSEVLRHICGGYYSTIIKHLILSEIIKLESNYLVGSRSNGYILVSNRGAKLYTFSNSKFVEKMASQHKKNIALDSKLLCRLHRSMTKLDLISKASLTDIEFKFAYFLENHKFQTVGTKGHRVYNNFCNLPKSLRDNLTIGGEKLAFVDIVNSQMVFLSSVINKTLQNHYAHIEESTRLFFELASNGMLYDHLMQVFCINNRKFLKEEIFTIIFGRNSFSKNLPGFGDLFPQIMDVIKFLKKDDYRVLAHQMQKMEAKVVFQAVDLLDYDKEILTVHDSIYGVESDIDLILDALAFSFNKNDITAVINVNDDYQVNVKDYCTYHNQIDRILKDTEPLEILYDFGDGPVNIVEDEIRTLRLIPLDQINNLLSINGFKEKLETWDEKIIKNLALKTAKDFVQSYDSVVTIDDDPFFDLPF